MSEVGIPVHANGDPVRRTVLVCANWQHANMWAMYSQVNLRSRNLIVPIPDTYKLRGLRDFDVVYYGPFYDNRNHYEIVEILDYLMATRPSAEAKTYRQYEAYQIEPNVVDR